MAVSPAGGCHPDMVYCWDLQQEVCSSLIRTSTPGSIPVSVDRILLGAYSAGSSASCMHPALLVAACSDATLRCALDGGDSGCVRLMWFPCGRLQAVGI
eukprot:1157234-Pelagomonas_calceolata.AAC.7